MKPAEPRASVSGSGQAAPRVRNRRVDRTRQALLGAFVELLLARGYARVTVRDIIARADVGRSTFYEHYQNKAELLADSLAPVLEPLAELASAHPGPDRLPALLAHIWESRERTGPIMLGSSRPVMTRLLADRLWTHLRTRRVASPRADLRLIAAALAAAQIAVLAAWLTEHGTVHADEVGGTLRVLTGALVAAVQRSR